MGTRQTLRKKITTQILKDEFGGGPSLLDELRWKVTQEINEHNETSKKILHINNTLKKSFSRTIRHHLDGFDILKIPNPDRIPLGIIARSAIFRISSVKRLNTFLSSRSRLAIFSLESASVINKLSGGRIPVYFIRCELCTKYPFDDDGHWQNSGFFDHTKFPVSSPILVVTQTNMKLTKHHLKNLAKTNCQLFRKILTRNNPYHGMRYRTIKISPINSFRTSQQQDL